MSNPYRARPSTKSNMGHDKKVYASWNPTSIPQSNIPPSNSVQHSRSLVNQSQQMSDSWAWENGNDSWDWNPDQPSEIQQQQPQQNFLPPYPKQGQLSSTQDSYYTNVNGNKSNISNSGQQQSHTDPFASYPTYHSLPPKTNPTGWNHPSENLHAPNPNQSIDWSKSNDSLKMNEYEGNNATRSWKQKDEVPSGWQNSIVQESQTFHGESKDNWAMDPNWPSQWDNKNVQDREYHSWPQNIVQDDKTIHKKVPQDNWQMISQSSSSLSETMNPGISDPNGRRPIHSQDVANLNNNLQLEEQNKTQPLESCRNSETIEDNIDFNSHTNSTDSLITGFSQIHLTKQHKNLENQSSEEQSTSFTEEWSSQTNSSNVHNNGTPDYPSSMDNSHTVETQDQIDPVKPIDMVYDQWYNQNTTENPGQSKDRSRSSKPWVSEQNLENYENIQQPTEIDTPGLKERDIYGSRDSMNKETLDNDSKQIRDFKQEVNNVEVPFNQVRRPVQQSDEMPDNYEFASNDRNTFLETGELTDIHLGSHEPTPPNQDDENDEVPNDIPFLREVPGSDQYAQSNLRIVDPRRNDPSGQEQNLLTRNVPERVERRQQRHSRDDPSGEEGALLESQNEIREIPGRGHEPEQSDNLVRQILGATSSNNDPQSPPDNNGRIVTGSQVLCNDPRKIREEAVGASMGEEPTLTPQNRRNSFVDEDDNISGHSDEDSRERRRDITPEGRRYEYERKNSYYDREYEEDYYYDRRRVGDMDRSYNRDDFDRRNLPYREDERKHHSRDDLDRHARDDVERRGRNKNDYDERDGKRRLDPPKRRRERPGGDDSHRREYDPRYSRDRDYSDRDRRKDDRRPRKYEYDSRDPYRRDTYYDDSYNRSSRPSSRSSYNDRDREFFTRSRDPYYNYNGYGGYDYGTNYYNYLENLRRTNPAAYAEWYHKYFANTLQPTTRNPSDFSKDRTSVPSGRSSCEERTSGDERNFRLLESPITASARMTPNKYTTAHVHGFLSVGSLVHVAANYPASGDRAKVDIFRMDNLLSHDPIAREMRAYPGPLIKQVGVTHKKTIIDYCENKIKKAASNDEIVDYASYVLLYELMIMLIQQNGNVVGVDIAGLLLRNKNSYPCDPEEKTRRESVVSQRSNTTEVINSETTSQTDHTKQRVTDEFRNALLYGLVQEALEYAMNEELWGHALFLASKLDKRTYASVMTRFANSLSHLDPLQTLYQLHSGRVPAIVTCAGDPRWGDWRPHLAMIISNTSSNPEINRRSITSLGDTLFAKGNIYAAHFCYILAQVDFGHYGDNNVKLVLVGSNHLKPYNEFMTSEAIMLTEIYEYARNLSEPGFTLVNLQHYKFDLAKKLIDYGYIEKSLLYLEQIAVNIINEPSKYNRRFIEDVYTLGDRIKYNDPICKDNTEDVATLNWLNKLLDVLGKYQVGEIIEDDGHKRQEQVDNNNSQNVDQWNVSEQPTVSLDSNQGIVNLTTTYDTMNPYQDYNNPQTSYNNWDQGPSPLNYPTTQPIDNNNQDTWNYEPMVSPSISIAPSSSNQYDPLEGLVALETPNQVPKTTTDSKKVPERKSEKKGTTTNNSGTGGGGGSWIGGLFSKLVPKPKNQMILPDDNNPTIVWDEVSGKWINKEEEDSNGTSALVAPPKASDMGYTAPSMTTLPQTNLPSSPSLNDSKPMTSAGNMFKLPKGRNLRSNYIDVMNPNRLKSNSPLGASSTASSQMFIPDSNPSMSYITPSSEEDHSAQTGQFKQVHP